MRTSLRLVLVLVFFAAGLVFAQQQAPPKVPAEAQPAAQPAAQPGPKAAAFDTLFAEWKTLLTELRKLREEYGPATPERQKEIAARYDELIAKGITMQTEVSKAAEEAYAESPGANKDVEVFLLATCNGNFKMDNYEEALRLADLLIKNKCPEKNLFVWGGMSAYCVGELDKAEKYLAAAAQAGAELKSDKETLDAMVMQFLQDPEARKADWKKEQEIRAAEAKADDLPRVLLKTNRGDIEIELFENEAPIATANFISLVEKGFYNGLGFHRVLDGFMAQGGDPKGDGSGGPDYKIPCECHQPNFRKHFRGSLSMAHAGRDTGGSQFFLTFIPTSFLDGKHTAFGRVVKGIDVLAKIRRRNPDDAKATLPSPDKILEAKVLRKRAHEYVPKKVGG
jgi:cyclophilin family peptidyl-prolyl cis-trans isomerase